MSEIDPVAAYLDSLAEELKAEYPSEGEYTVTTYMAEMEKRRLTLSITSATRILGELVKSGKWTVRRGHLDSGKSANIYRPVLDE
jgi:hypothetical protein